MLIRSNPQFPAGSTLDQACRTILEQWGTGCGAFCGLSSQRSLKSVPGQLQWSWAKIAIEWLLTHLTTWLSPKRENDEN